ncbi:beta-galactosidase GalB [Fulvivirga ligni]|uniref:beta-galactosidase GalB n=1 Tax=Fulvivirga ligni TaxID=2904246 RepID=UPI001F1E3EFF|nr:beta-galactosidase GalB [Fulvivirga ligni]UII23318.1 DUF4982 domain-containing protein [Fulvivirga ligni]
MPKLTSFFVVIYLLLFSCESEKVPSSLEESYYNTRQRISINEGWKFMKYASVENADSLTYDVRPEITDDRDEKPADEKPTEAVEVASTHNILKPWIMPTGNSFIKDAFRHYKRPEGDPGKDFPFVKADFDDATWEVVDLPHDWAIKGQFMEGWDAAVGGGMGRLPSPGVGWYRRKIAISEADQDKNIYLDIDGAMSYAMVWLNGHLVGGWPYGYSSWRVELTPYLKEGDNQLAIRVDNPSHSSRWYPGGGIYRNVWLVKTNPTHVSHWGASVTTEDVSKSSARIHLEIEIENNAFEEKEISLQTDVYEINEKGERTGAIVSSFEPSTLRIAGKTSVSHAGITTLKNPKLWGPPPNQTPNLYVAVTTLLEDGEPIDHYETTFGVRSIKFDADKGLLVNGEHVFIKGVNQHHDLGALGAAFNARAAERQLVMLKELGANAIRIAHNPPAPELLEMTDRMGFLVVDELYDCWERKKNPLDFHLIFPDWHEQDLRALIRRDRNHPSVIMWSTGNEVGEQYTGEDGARVAQVLREIANDEDPTRPTTTSMNYAKPNMPISEEMEIMSLNYQGEGIRNATAYSHLKGINTAPLYPAFHDKFPNKMIVSSENAAALSSRGTYLFPVAEEISSPIGQGIGGDPEKMYVSAYELYTADFGSSADKVFASIDKHPYVSGGFVWSGWDYLGEPTPYYLARSSYFGLIDLAGFKKDRFYLYQARWRPDYPMAHILPHWNWPNRVGKVTPVHIFTSGDEAELFLNGKSLGKKKKGEYEYRLRWDDVIYEPGELKVIAYKDGKQWAEEIVKTTEAANKVILEADKKECYADGKDLIFITARVADHHGSTVPQADNLIEFSIDGPGEIVATDNGDPTDMTAFPSHSRKAFGGLALVIIKAKKGESGIIKITAKSSELSAGLQNIAIINP